MIDHATLPITAAGEHLSIGQRFEVYGQNFDLWPSEIVMGYNRDVIRHYETGHYMALLVEKTKTKLVFEVTLEMTIPTEHLWDVFGSPFLPERTLLSYE